jgi:predicted GTPase
LLVIDGKKGVTENEIRFSRTLKQSGLIDKVILVVNKM